MFNQDQVNRLIEKVYNSHKKMLSEKNKRYGNAALDPLGIFSKEGDSLRSMFVRLDDKLSRIKNSEELRKNDVSDIIGYLMLVCINKGWTDFSDLID
jgi:hypothetical protein